jgi:hypothetical protein
MFTLELRHSKFSRIADVDGRTAPQAKKLCETASENKIYLQKISNFMEFKKFIYYTHLCNKHQTKKHVSGRHKPYQRAL